MIDDGGERAVQFGNFGFVFISEGKVKDVQIFRHAFGFGGFCQHDDVALNQPAGNHLRLQAVSDGLGITWLPHIIAADALHSGQLVELLPEYAITYDPLYLYYPSRRGHSNAFKLIVDALKVKAG